MFASITDVVVADLIWQKKSAHMSAKGETDVESKQGRTLNNKVMNPYATCACDSYKLWRL